VDVQALLLIVIQESPDPLMGLPLEFLSLAFELKDLGRRGFEDLPRLLFLLGFELDLLVELLELAVGGLLRGQLPGLAQLRSGPGGLLGERRGRERREQHQDGIEGHSLLLARVPAKSLGLQPETVQGRDDQGGVKPRLHDLSGLDVS